MKWTPLHYAARKGDVTIMSSLIKHGADPEVKDKDGLTPLDVLYTTFGLSRPQRAKPLSGFNLLKEVHNDDDDDDDDDEEESAKSSRKHTANNSGGDGSITELYSWGDGSTFQLGHGTQDSKPKPKKIRTLSGVSIVAVSASKTHVLALASSGQAYSWGSGGGSGKLGHGSNSSSSSGGGGGGSTVPIPEPLSAAQFGGRRVVAVAAGGAYSGFITDFGHVYVCGGGGNFQTIFSPRRLSVPTERTQVRFGQISMGNAHMVALSTAGRAYAWGDGTYGQLGTTKGTPAVWSSLSPVPGIESVKMTMVCAGAAHCAAVSTGGKLYVWGGVGAPSKVTHVPITEDRDPPEEGFSLAPCRRKGRPQKAITVTHATAYESTTTVVSASGKIYIVEVTDQDPIEVPFGKKSAREAWLAPAGLYAVTRTGALGFVPREPVDAYLRSVRTSDEDEDYWVVHGVHAEEAVPYPTTLLYSVGVFAAAPSCAFATVPATPPVECDGTPQSTFVADMGALAASGAYADITLCTADGTTASVPAHRLLVSQCSEFSALECGAKVITAARTDPELRDFVRLLYTGACQHPEQTAKVAATHGLTYSRNSSAQEASIKEHLRQMYRSRRYTDVTLSCPGLKDGTFPAHRAVLSARCEYFAAMFGSGMREAGAPVVGLCEVAPNILGHLLDFLYTDSLGLAGAKLAAKLDALVTADEFLVPSMCDAATREIAGDINADTILEVAEVASGHRFHRLQDLCTRFLVANPIALVCTPVLFELDGFIRDEVLAVSYQKAMAAEQLSKKPYYKVVVPPPASAKIFCEETDTADDSTGVAVATDATSSQSLQPKSTPPPPQLGTKGSSVCPRKKMNSKQKKQLQKRMEQEKKEREAAEAEAAAVAVAAEASNNDTNELSFWDTVGDQKQQSEQAISGVEDSTEKVKIKIVRPQPKSKKQVQFGTDDALEFIDPQEALKKKKKNQAPPQQSAWKTLPQVKAAPIVPITVKTPQPSQNQKQKPQPQPQPQKQQKSVAQPPPPPSPPPTTTAIQNDDNDYQPKEFQFNLAEAVEASTKRGKRGIAQQQQEQQKQKQRQQPHPPKHQTAWGELPKKENTQGSGAFKSLKEIQEEELAKKQGKKTPNSWGSVTSGKKDIKGFDEILNTELRISRKK